MTTTTVNTSDELVTLLDDLANAGVNDVALLVDDEYDVVLFLTSTAPDGTWYTLKDDSGNGYDFTRDLTADELSITPGSVVLYGATSLTVGRVRERTATISSPRYRA